MPSARIYHDNTIVEAQVGPDGRISLPDGSQVVHSDIRYAPAAAGTVLGVALNDLSQLPSVAAAFDQPPHEKPPRTPVLFVKTANTLTGHLASVQCPYGADHIQPGGSLAAVIGSDVPQFADGATALAAVRGYTILNDFSLPQPSFYRPPVRVKGYDSFGPLGPVVVEADSIVIDDLCIQTVVNDTLRQTTRLADMKYKLPALLEFITSISSLRAGDVIALSVPIERIDVGVGDTVTIRIDGVGELTNQVVSADDYFASRRMD